MVKVSKEVEHYIVPMYKLLYFKINTPKWIGIRFLMNISLSLKQRDYKIEMPKLDGKEYKLIQITGENKIEGDYTSLYKKMIEVYDKMEIKNNYELERRIEYHIQRGYQILKKSLKSNSNIYEFLYHEF